MSVFDYNSIRPLKLTEKLEIGPGKRTALMVDVGANHFNDFEIAKNIIVSCASVGVDIVKFQSYRADSIYSKLEHSEYWNLIKKYEMPESWHYDLFEIAKSNNITWVSTPFDVSMLELLEKVNVPFYKIASFELTHRHLLKAVAETKKPIILSTGLANLSEIEYALNYLEKNGSGNFSIMHCVSNYPTEPQDLNLKRIQTLKSTFNIPVGLSSHCTDIHSDIAAVCLGVDIIEKHVTFDPSREGPDQKMAYDIPQTADLVRTMRKVESMLGDGRKKMVDSEKSSRQSYYRSLVAARDLSVGYTLSEQDIEIKRPGNGISPQFYEHVIGRVVTKPLQKDEAITWEKL